MFAIVIAGDGLYDDRGYDELEEAFCREQAERITGTDQGAGRTGEPFACSLTDNLGLYHWGGVVASGVPASPEEGWEVDGRETTGLGSSASSGVYRGEELEAQYSFLPETSSRCSCGEIASEGERDYYLGSCVQLLGSSSSSTPTRPQLPEVQGGSWQRAPSDGSGATRGTATHYGESYNGRPLGCGGTYWSSDPSIAATPWTRERGHLYPCGTVLRLSGPAGELVVVVQDACPGCSWEPVNGGRFIFGFLPSLAIHLSCASAQAARLCGRFWRWQRDLAKSSSASQPCKIRLARPD